MNSTKEEQHQDECFPHIFLHEHDDETSETIRKVCVKCGYREE